MPFRAAAGLFSKAPTIVAIVDDEEDLCANIALFLRVAGFEVWSADSAERFYRQLATRRADVVIVDIGLPGEDGLSLIAHLQDADQRRGVIALTARGSVADRIAGLEAGADLYFVKPVDLYELSAGIQALVRKLAPKAARDEAAAVPEAQDGVAPWLLDTIAGTLHAPAGKAITLTSREFALVEAMMLQPQELISKSALMALFEADPLRLDFHRVESMLSRLRKKVLEETGQVLPVRSVFGKGLVWAGACRVGPGAAG